MNVFGQRLFYKEHLWILFVSEHIGGGICNNSISSKQAFVNLTEEQYENQLLSNALCLTFVMHRRQR